LKLYSYSQIKEIYKVVYDYNFNFNSFISAYKFYKDYSLKTREKMALMAINNKDSSEGETSENKVSSSSSSYNELSYDKLYDAYYKLLGEFKKLVIKYTKLKKSHSSILYEKEKKIETHLSMLHEKEKEIDELKKENKLLVDRFSFYQNLINENAMLKEKVEDLKKSLDNSKDGKANVKVVQGSHRKLDVKLSHASKRTKTKPRKRNHKRKCDGSSFSQSCTQFSSTIVYHSCHKQGHKMHDCPFMNKAYNKKYVLWKQYF
ncbi:hypothetical protein OC709_02470, partial ['Planchonia careya' phytoplasma]